MVKIALQFKAQLENVTNLKATGEDFRWYIKVKCMNCGEESHEIYCTLEESSELKGGRGHASVVLKCKLCSRENSIDIIKESISAYKAEDTGKFKPIVAFDCRGVEPVHFSPRLGWRAEGTESGTVFEDIDLKENEFYDYDEKAKESVSITDLEFKFVKTH